MEWTSMYPKILERINRTDKYKENPLKLSDIYNRKDLINIKSKWNNIPMGLNDEQLQEYFITGKVPKIKIKEEIEIDDTSMQIPPINIEPSKQVAEVKPQVTEDTADVSAEVIASQPNQNVVGSSGLTATEMAWLSPAEKAMRLKSKGLA